ncbi:hypothetical protein DL96DRAFT_1707635 [Flagelloscypha sp. PMI_526]|nr:hypothetical protein DL96DRAFT_1707635 [Flagelloscypha sp. PMI_526]
MSLLKTWKASFPFSAPSLTRPEDVMNNGFSLAGSSSDPATGAFNGSSPVLNAPLPSGSTVRKRVREDSPSSSPQEKVPAPLAKRRKTDVLADLLPEIVDRSDTIFHASEKTYASHLLEAVQLLLSSLFIYVTTSAFLLGSFFSWAIEAHQHAHSTGFSGTGLVVADDEKVLKVMAHEINTAFRSLTSTAGVVLVYISSEFWLYIVQCFHAHQPKQLYDALEDRAFSLDQAHSLAILNAQSLKDCHPNDEIPILQIMKAFLSKKWSTSSSSCPSSCHRTGH